MTMADSAIVMLMALTVLVHWPSAFGKRFNILLCFSTLHVHARRLDVHHLVDQVSSSDRTVITRSVRAYESETICACRRHERLLLLCIILFWQG